MSVSLLASLCVLLFHSFSVPTYLPMTCAPASVVCVCVCVYVCTFECVFCVFCARLFWSQGWQDSKGTGAATLRHADESTAIVRRIARFVTDYVFFPFHVSCSPILCVFFPLFTSLVRRNCALFFPFSHLLFANCAFSSPFSHLLLAEIVIFATGCLFFPFHAFTNVYVFLRRPDVAAHPTARLCSLTQLCSASEFSVVE
jgi:hypothetical protein